MLFHVILIFGISATSQSSTSYTAIYTGVESFVVTALMSVIIVMAPLRNDVIILTFISLPLYSTRYLRFDISLALGGVHVHSSLPGRSPLLSSHLYFKVTIFLACNNKKSCFLILC
jgi:hypothetical protein